MLFHTLADPEAGHYVEQFTCGLRGELDLPALQEAWHRLIARHPALRSTIHWSDCDRPYQVVHRRATPLVEYHDWRGLADAEQTGAARGLPRLGPPDADSSRRGRRCRGWHSSGSTAISISSSGASITS